MKWSMNTDTPTVWPGAVRPSVSVHQTSIHQPRKRGPARTAVRDSAATDVVTPRPPIAHGRCAVELRLGLAVPLASLPLLLLDRKF